MTRSLGCRAPNSRIADWYAHRGYLVQTNSKFGPRPKGGYEGEMDVIAVKFSEHKLVHIETSSDADSWTQRYARIEKKFASAAKYYSAVFGMEFDEPERIAVVGVRPAKKPVALKGIAVKSIDELMSEIKVHVRKHDPMSQAIPENYGYLRAVQFAVWFGADD